MSAVGLFAYSHVVLQEKLKLLKSCQIRLLWKANRFSILLCKSKVKFAHVQMNSAKLIGPCFKVKLGNDPEQLGDRESTQVNTSHWGFTSVRNTENLLPILVLSFKMLAKRACKKKPKKPCELH